MVFRRLEHLSLSYNGGKDCLVLLVLILACLPKLLSSQNTTVSSAENNIEQTSTSPSPSLSALTRLQPLEAIYIVSRHPFPEVEEFVSVSVRKYHLELHRYELPMREALEAYLNDRTAIQAIFMGTRRTDPHSDTLGHFSPTDKGWPQFMRVNPVIDWHYADIWAVRSSMLDIGLMSSLTANFSSSATLIFRTARFTTRASPRSAA